MISTRSETLCPSPGAPPGAVVHLSPSRPRPRAEVVGGLLAGWLFVRVGHGRENPDPYPRLPQIQAFPLRTSRLSIQIRCIAGKHHYLHHKKSEFKSPSRFNASRILWLSQLHPWMRLDRISIPLSSPRSALLVGRSVRRASGPPSPAPWTPVPEKTGPTGRRCSRFMAQLSN